MDDFFPKLIFIISPDLSTNVMLYFNMGKSLENFFLRQLSDNFIGYIGRPIQELHFE